SISSHRWASSSSISPADAEYPVPDRKPAVGSAGSRWITEVPNWPRNQRMDDSIHSWVFASIGQSDVVEGSQGLGRSSVIGNLVGEGPAQIRAYHSYRQLDARGFCREDDRVDVEGGHIQVRC